MRVSPRPEVEENMPLRYVNPAPRRNAATKLYGAALAAHRRKKFADRKKRPLSGAAKAAHEKRNRQAARRVGSLSISNPGARKISHAKATHARSRKKRAVAAKPRAKKKTTAALAPRHNPRKRKKTMARKKLYGAAATAHAKKRRGAKRRRNPSHKTKARKSKARKRKPARHSSRGLTKRERAAHRKMTAALRGFHTRAKKRRSFGERIRRQRRSKRVTGMQGPIMQGNPARRRRRRRRNPATTVRSLRRARRTLRNRPRTRGARKYARKYRMRSNPRRHRRRYRRNPRTTVRAMMRARRSIRNRKDRFGAAYATRYRMRSNPGGAFVDALKSAAFIAAPLYLARAASYSLASKVPGLNMVPAKFQGTAMAALLGVVGHFATKKIAKLAKYRSSVMIGLGLNFLDNALSALAPATLKSRIGLAGDVFADGLGDYVSVAGAPPIDDNMTLSDYVSVSDYVEVGAEEELGATVEEELGLEQELGMDNLLGGIAQSSMLAPVAPVSPLQTVPARSFTKDVPRAGQGYDNPRNLYGGVFSGGFGG